MRDPLSLAPDLALALQAGDAPVTCHHWREAAVSQLCRRRSGAGLAKLADSWSNLLEAAQLHSSQFIPLY